MMQRCSRGRTDVLPSTSTASLNPVMSMSRLRTTAHLHRRLQGRAQTQGRPRETQLQTHTHPILRGCSPEAQRPPAAQGAFDTACNSDVGLSRGAAYRCSRNAGELARWSSRASPSDPCPSMSSRFSTSRDSLQHTTHEGVHLAEELQASASHLVGDRLDLYAP